MITLLRTKAGASQRIWLRPLNLSNEPPDIDNSQLWE
jgi:hypothetical protein